MVMCPSRQLRQLGDVGGDVPGLVAGEQLGRRPSSRLVLAIDTYGWPGGRRLRGQGVTARVIVVLRDGWLQFRQIGAPVPVGVAASKKNQSVPGLVFGRKPHGLLDTDKVAGVLAPAV